MREARSSAGPRVYIRAAVMKKKTKQRHAPTETHATDVNLVSSPALPADPAWSRSQARFEDAVGDGTYLADPDFEWEEEVEETKHGGS